MRAPVWFDFPCVKVLHPICDLCYITPCRFGQAASKQAANCKMNAVEKKIPLAFEEPNVIY
ncbi:hypothetical protein SD70_31980 [Gordoniibacillus kamchatkensis]|uniref:Uncharacterized protein n=1 Tax=Gordoniibacillus kamchatkensis TaxID=1590651 RepID=A0ABR5A577_9BACL|nr:hypothetical protein SD70_31980 [Paenibacillus sp. VKM B-2647]